MAFTFAELVTETQARLSKGNEAAGGLVGSTRVGVWVNTAIRDIALGWPGLRNIHVMDKHTWKTQDSVYEYNLDDFQEYQVAHIVKIKYVSTGKDRYWTLDPYVGGLDAWDAEHPYIPDENTGDPTHYVRRGDMVEVLPMPGSDEANSMLWLEYSYLPRDISSTTKPVLKNFDEQIVAFAMSYALNAMNQSDRALQQRQFASAITQERVDNEKDFDDVDMMYDASPNP